MATPPALRMRQRSNRAPAARANDLPSSSLKEIAADYTNNGK
jgi:hypothetical protein